MVPFTKIGDQVAGGRWWAQFWVYRAWQAYGTSRQRCPRSGRVCMEIWKSGVVKRNQGSRWGQSRNQREKESFRKAGTGHGVQGYRNGQARWGLRGSCGIKSSVVTGGLSKRCGGRHSGQKSECKMRSRNRTCRPCIQEVCLATWQGVGVMGQVFGMRQTWNYFKVIVSQTSLPKAKLKQKVPVATRFFSRMFHLAPQKFSSS